MGICRNVWGDASGVWPYGKTAIPYGKMACVWEAVESHGEPRKHMGNATGYGNLRRHMGRPPDRMGSQNRIKTRNMGTVAACGLGMFL